MNVTPRLAALLAFTALLPLVVYAAGSGELTPVTGAVGVVNVVLIGSSLLVMFGPTGGDGESEGTTTH
jgi:hypothetical protein